MYNLIKTIILALGFSIIVNPVFANDLSITNVVLGQRNTAAKTLVIQFNVNWKNSWRNKINHDAIWLTVRLNQTDNTTQGKKLCQIAASGINPTGLSVGSLSSLEFYVPSDKQGAFLRRANYSTIGDITTNGAQLTIKYDSCGFSDSDQVTASIFGLEMVLIPEGNFYAGDGQSTGALNRGSSDANPWSITSESAITVANPVSSGYRYVSAGNSGEFATGAEFNVPQNFPKGYGAFYMMKYELTEGQWVEFINALPSAARNSRDITDATHKNSDDVLNRNAIVCSGNPLTCSTNRPSRAVSFLSWPDLAAFLDWNALRPMSELEFEKASRGPEFPIAGQYAWGTTDITAASVISATEDGTETIINADANAHYNATVLSGGDADQGGGYNTGALRAGIFASSASNRVLSGAGFYGAMELSGNVKEYAVTVGNSNGLVFTGNHGDGVLTTASGYEGNANVSNWPGFDGISERGITGFDGIGLRGGSWADNAAGLAISDRSQASAGAVAISAQLGGRGVRSYDGN